MNVEDMEREELPKKWKREESLNEWEKEWFEKEKGIIELEIKLLDKPKEEDEIKKIKKKKRELKKMKHLKKYNWLSDPSLHWSEKVFHFSTLVCGFIILFFSLFLLCKIANNKDIQGISSIASVVVLMILIIFSFLCISGRGLETAEKLRNRIEKAELIKLWGLTIKGFHKEEVGKNG